jgi:hypothetical protein
MRTQTLSKEAEQGVIDAVKRAVSLVDDGGLTPDAAIEKIARAERWGPDMIKFASYAYNTGRQTAQREAAGDALSKFADFAIADPEKVAAAIWPATVDRVKAATGASAEYASPPAWIAAKAASDRRTVLLAPHREKVARDGPTGPAGPRGMDAGELVDRMRHLKRAADEARVASAREYDRLIVNFNALAGYFKRAAMDRIPLAHAEYGLSAYFGDAGTRLVDYVAVRNNAKEARYAPGVKLAAVVSVDLAEAPWSLAKACIDQGAAVAAARVKHASAAQAVDDFVGKYEVLRPFVRGDRSNKSAAAPAQAGPWSALSDTPAPAKSAGLLGWTGFSLVNNGTKNLLDSALSGGPDAEQRVNGDWEKLEDPAHDAELTKIRTESMLSDLMHDEVLSGYHPEQILNAYNQIAQMAPRTARNQLPTLALLRRHLSGNMEPHETNQITQMEQGLMGTEKDTPAGRSMREAPQSVLG